MHKFMRMRFAIPLLILSTLCVSSAVAAGPSLNLPPGSFTVSVTFDPLFNQGAYFNVVFGTPPIPAGFDIVQGAKYLGWCVETDDTLGTLSSLTLPSTFLDGPYKLYNSYGPLPADAMSPNWGAVNWLLNNKNAAGPATTVDIQEAIWQLLNGKYDLLPPLITSAPSATTTALVTLALTHNNFVPATGQVVAVFLDGGDGLLNNGTDLQSIIIEVTVPSQPIGCPATQGFWHKGSNWPNIDASVDGVIYNGGSDHSMVIGGVTYTQGQLLALLPSGSLHTGGYVNALSQFIAGVLNLAAGAQHSTIDSTISAINTDLTGVTFVTGDGSALNPYALAPISASLQSTLAGFETTLDSYNSATGLNCTEGSGLTIGGASATNTSKKH